jgi:hypothetical protein
MNRSMTFVATVASVMAVTPTAATAEEPAADASGPVCTYGYAKGPTWTSASIGEECDVKMQARICRYDGGIRCYDGPEAAFSRVSAKNGVNAGHYWRGQILPGKQWSNWASF